MRIYPKCYLPGLPDISSTIYLHGGQWLVKSDFNTPKAYPTENFILAPFCIIAGMFRNVLENICP